MTQSTLKPWCPYGTYQRATSGIPVMMITPRILMRGIHGLFKQEARRGRQFRAARHSVFLGALQHLHSDRETIRHFRL